MAQVPPQAGNYYHHQQHIPPTRSITPSYYVSNGSNNHFLAPNHLQQHAQQSNQNRISSMYAPNVSSTYLHYNNGAVKLNTHGANAPVYSNSYRPQSAFYMGNMSDEPSNSFVTSKGSLTSASSPSIASLSTISAPTQRTMQPRSRSYSASSTHQLNSSTVSTDSAVQPSLVVAPAPDRYHRRKSIVVLGNTSSHGHSQSASSISTNNTPTSTASSTSTSSSSAMSNPSPSTAATNTPLSNSTTSLPSSPVPTEAYVQKQPLHQPQTLQTQTFPHSIYKHSTNAGSVSAFSTSSSSKKDYSSMSSVSSFNSDVPKPTRKPVSTVKSSTGSKPFIASSVTPVPNMPPPLVLPSEIRRNSLATGGRSRSSSSSPAPTNNNTSTSHLNSQNHQPVPLSQNPYNNAPVVNSASRPPIKSTYSEYTGRPISRMTNDDQQRSKSMTTSSLAEKAKLQTQPQPQHEPQQPVVKQKQSFSQKLKKAFSFGKKSSTESKTESKPEKSERTFSLSFSKKSRSNTMNASVTPLYTGKKSGRSMTLSNMNSSNRTSTMTSTTAPTFEGFDSVFVDTRKKKGSRAKSQIDDDVISLKSNASISSFATLKKMSKNLFNKNSIPSSSSHQSVAAEINSLDSLSKSTSDTSIPSVDKPSEQNSLPQSFNNTSLSSVESERPRSRSISTIAADDVISSPSIQPPTPTRTDVDSIVTDAASTIKVSTTSPDETSVIVDEESDEDLNVADTVFPKSLDSDTVETIRTSLDRTKSLERRRSRRSNRSNPSINSVEKRSTQPDTLDVQHIPQNTTLNNPPNLNTSPHSILKPATTSSIPETEVQIPVIATRNRNSLKPSPSISSIFDFGDSDINLDLNFDFAPAAAAGLETEVKKYKSNLRSKPKDYTFTETKASDNKRGNKLYHPMYQPQSPVHNQRSSSSNSNHSNTRVVFSPRIIIYDTYDPLEYDRHAEPATCNRLTPLLAQQIKEELNSLKMEMEVHADSRIYTHFF